MKYKVRDMRIKRGMTQEELAKRANVSRNTIVAIENGGDYVTTTGTLAKIAAALKCGVCDIFVCGK